MAKDRKSGGGNVDEAPVVTPKEPEQLPLPFDRPPTPEIFMWEVRVEPLGPFRHFLPPSLTQDEAVKQGMQLTRQKVTIARVGFDEPVPVPEVK